jgi:hypothetical protein
MIQIFAKFFMPQLFIFTTYCQLILHAIVSAYISCFYSKRAIEAPVFPQHMFKISNIGAKKEWLFELLLENVC